MCPTERRTWFKKKIVVWSGKEEQQRTLRVKGTPRAMVMHVLAGQLHSRPRWQIQAAVGGRCALGQASPREKRNGQMAQCFYYVQRNFTALLENFREEWYRKESHRLKNYIEKEPSQHPPPHQHSEVRINSRKKAVHTCTYKIRPHQNNIHIFMIKY